MWGLHDIQIRLKKEGKKNKSKLRSLTLRSQNINWWHSVKQICVEDIKEKRLQPLLGVSESLGGAEVGVMVNTDAVVFVDAAVFVDVVGATAVVPLAAAEGEDHRRHHHVETSHSKVFLPGGTLIWGQDWGRTSASKGKKTHYRWGRWYSESDREGFLAGCEWRFEALQKRWHWAVSRCLREWWVQEREWRLHSQKEETKIRPDAESEPPWPHKFSMFSSNSNEKKKQAKTHPEPEVQKHQQT